MSEALKQLRAELLEKLETTKDPLIKDEIKMRIDLIEEELIADFYEA